MANGKWNWWNINGQLSFELNYKDDKFHGVQKEWSNEGNLISHSTYVNGLCISGDCEE